MQDGSHQNFKGITLGCCRIVLKHLGQPLHFFGKQRRAIELDHLQGAVDLVNVGQAEANPGSVLRILNESFKCMLGLLQRFGNLTLHPLQSDIIVPICHIHSIHTVKLPCG